MSRCFSELQTRDFIAQSSSPALETLLDGKGVKCYVGFDPTAKSLHLGHLVPVMALAFLQRAGHVPIVLLGGATGMIGDPSGRSKERNLLTPETVKENALGLRSQLERFIRFEGPGAAVLVDNNDWIAPMSHVDWLREVGKHFSVNYMLNKESVRGRLREKASALTYTEFSYMLLQAYDFVHLFDAMGCLLQAGGNDQWGNITAGIDLVRKARGKEVYGMTFPLITTASGKKFGKSEAGNVWLDATLTSPYDFYKYWINTADKDAVRFLKLFTFLGMGEIERLAAEQSGRPEGRAAQRALAFEATKIVHGEAEARKAEAASVALFGKVSAEAAVKAPTVRLPRRMLDGGLSVVELLVATKLAASKREARRLIEQGGLQVNGKKCTDSDRRLTPADLMDGGTVLLRKGKSSHTAVHFTQDSARP